MARTPLLQLNDISLTFGGDPVFDALDLVVQPGDRLALVGRNGSGKSTLMKVMAGLVEADRGARFVAPGCSVGYMQQDPDMTGFATLGDFAISALEPGEMYRVERAGEKLKFDPDRPVSTASGGERRRAALAKLMAEAPGLMLLDEPTNDLDVETLRALEDALMDFAGCAVVISHDRFFLDRICTHILAFEGEAHVEWFEGDFSAYEEDKKRRLGPDALEPKRIKHKKFTR